MILSLFYEAFGKTRFKNTPTIAPRPIPAKGTPPKLKVIPPIEKTKIIETIAIFRGQVKSVFDLASVLIPKVAIIPKSKSIIPPITGVGIVAKIAPSFPINAKSIAQIAAQVIIAGLYAFVTVTAPVTSEYVVLGGPPKSDATDVARPSPKSVFFNPGFFK